MEAENPVNSKTKQCSECMELIHEAAKICPVCKSSQYLSPWTISLNVIKWLGGITALISLVLAVAQLNNYFKGWREQQELVNELVDAAKIQQESGDYELALGLLEEANQLEPGSRNARQAKLNLAMKLIQTKRHWHKDLVKISNRLLPIITRGAASSDKQAAADANAHAGWAYILLTEATQGKYLIDKCFERALHLDANNTYAHAFWGYWTLCQYNENEYPISKRQKAINHFNKALENTKTLKLVRYLQISGIRLSNDVKILSEAFRVALQIKKRNEVLEPSMRDKLIRFYDYFSSNHKLASELTNEVLKSFDPKELLEAFKWLYTEHEQIHSPGNHDYERYNYTIAYFTAVAGEHEKAINLFKSLKPKLRSSSGYHYSIQNTVKKIDEDLFPGPRHMSEN